MFRHLILGLLQDDRSRHGYELMTLYKERSGHHVSAGNVYRELAKLVAEKMIEAGANLAGADPRRVPYRVTEKGRQAFESWLTAPTEQDADVTTRLLFVDRIPSAVLGQLLDRWQDNLWLRGKSLARARNDAVATNGRTGPVEPYSPLPLLISRQMKHVTAELDFLKELRTELDGRPNGKGRKRSGTGHDD